MPGQTFTVVDLFDKSAAEHANAREVESDYAGLTQQAFEKNYLAVHPHMCNVVRDYSQDIVKFVPPSGHRFVHIDASHLYEHVVGDIAASQQLLQPGGVVAFDDIRDARTPGVAAAVWPVVTRGDLKPLVITESKLYATKSDSAHWRARLQAWLPMSGLPYEVQRIAGQDVVRIKPRATPLRPLPARAYARVGRKFGWL